MSLLPQAQADQAKLLVAISAFALAAAYWNFPYSAREAQLAAETERAERLETANAAAARESAAGRLARLRADAAEQRAALTLMRRLVPTRNEMPALLEEVSTAARRTGLDIGGVTPAPIIPGSHVDTYRYTVTIIGGYHQVGEFLAIVGSLPRVIAPVGFTLSSGGVRGPQLRPARPGRSDLAASITLQTYVERVDSTTATPAPRPATGRRS